MTRITVCAALLWGLALFAWCLWVPAAWGWSLTVSWVPNTEADLAAYEVYYGTAPGVYGAPVWLSTTDPVDAGGGRVRWRLNGLKANTRYYVALKAYDTSSNPSGFSSEASGRTKGPCIWLAQ